MLAVYIPKSRGGMLAHAGIVSSDVSGYYLAMRLKKPERRTVAVVVACLSLLPFGAALVVMLVSFLIHPSDVGLGIVLWPFIFVANIVVDLLIWMWLRGIYRQQSVALWTAAVYFPLCAAGAVWSGGQRFHNFVVQTLAGCVAAVVGVMVLRIYVEEINDSKRHKRITR